MNALSAPSFDHCHAADARWRLHARAQVLLDLRSRRRIHPDRCAAEIARLWAAANPPGVPAKEPLHAIC